MQPKKSGCIPRLREGSLPHPATLSRNTAVTLTRVCVLLFFFIFFILCVLCEEDMGHRFTDASHVQGRKNENLKKIKIRYGKY